MSRFGTLVLGGGVAGVLIGGFANAQPAFKKSFEDRYVKDSGDEAMKEAFKKAGCNVCHVKGKEKNFRNAYGEELAKVIEGDVKARLEAAEKAGGEEGRKAELDKLVKELEIAFDKVEGVKSASGKTYGEVLKAHKLP